VPMSGDERLRPELFPKPNGVGFDGGQCGCVLRWVRDDQALASGGGLPKSSSPSITMSDPVQ
jgi:hypothetical protein